MTIRRFQVLITFRCDIVHVPFGDVEQFGLESVEKYEEALLSARNSGSRVKGLVLCNPHNPLGNCIPGL
jgi:bifunctional pyridoxal-dependent enzyme with beta-cystathionase and maltose regulon repressor activities